MATRIEVPAMLYIDVPEGKGPKTVRDIEERSREDSVTLVDKNGQRVVCFYGKARITNA